MQSPNSQTVLATPQLVQNKPVTSYCDAPFECSEYDLYARLGVQQFKQGFLNVFKSSCQPLPRPSPNQYQLLLHLNSLKRQNQSL